MALLFRAEDHAYISTDGADIPWVSGTKFIGLFKEKFDAIAISERVSKNRKSKWYGIKPQVIRDAWTAEATRASELGTWYHNQQEALLCGLDYLEMGGRQLPVVKPRLENGLKLAPPQRLSEGIYPEHLVYLKSAGICGQSDRVEVYNGRVHIVDYKTNKEITTKGFTNWEGITKKMNPPVAHLDECHLNTYALQLSLYLYMIQKHNPKLQPGTLTIQHVQFEEREEKDPYGYPITLLQDGEPVVKSITPYPVPYLRQEIIDMLRYFDVNRDKLLAA